MFATGAVPKQNGPFTLDFYADHDNSGGYDRDPVQRHGRSLVADPARPPTCSTTRAPS